MSPPLPKYTKIVREQQMEFLSSVTSFHQITTVQEHGTRVLGSKYMMPNDLTEMTKRTPPTLFQFWCDFEQWVFL